MTGSSQLVQALAAHDLVDGYKLWQFPVVLGAGKRLFAEGAAPAGLTLTDTQTSTTGVVISTYERQ